MMSDDFKGPGAHKHHSSETFSEICSEKLFTKRRIYYIDARRSSKESSGKNRYITLTESRKTMQGPQRSRIFIAEEDIDDFLSTFKLVTERMREGDDK
ncbi:MAG: DUF3276 family protein [SAR324 cluster bacterium]|nr:DUF3276 family protein [SAR324 cluster bacterium]